ncbi:MAG: hypothetical protein QNJ41_15730 [Xenococcaceae cyanobacterium MO_188.B32]|nr:hypothetical protein [Xenococcaceae cyanobacterium MO_188.B32]
METNKNNNSNIVFLIANERSGTNFLRSCLNSHPEIDFRGECLWPGLFDWGYYRFWSDKIKEDAENILPPNRVKVFEDYLFKFRAKSQAEWFGLDIKYPQLEGNYSFSKVIFSGRFYILHLLRKNLLKQVVSQDIMYKRINSGDKKIHRNYVPEIYRYKPDPKVIINKIKRFKNLQVKYSRIARESQAKYLEIYYEDIADEKSDFGKIFKFLGVEEIKQKSHLKKQNPWLLKDILINYQEIQQEISNTNFKHMLQLPG